jgi:D-serine dehydratase
VVKTQLLSKGFDSTALASSIEELCRVTIDARWKGIPPTASPIRIEDVVSKKWNLLAGDLPAPVAIIRKSALDANALWMRKLLARHDLLLAPHAKTTMSPHLFAHQANHGCWGLTVATAQQAEVAAHFGCRKIILANELIGQTQVTSILELLKKHSDLELYFFVDSAVGIASLAAHDELQAVLPRFRLLLDVGFAGGRTGCRNVAEAEVLLAEITRLKLPLAGIGGYEGLIATASGKEDPAGVDRYFDMFDEIAHLAEKSRAFADGDIVLTAGGSAYYDVVGRRLGQISLSRPALKILRSGCYVTHDCGTYERHQHEMYDRHPQLGRELGALEPSLFVCGLVQSRPEPDLALITMGKRDVGIDVDLPIAVWHYRKGKHNQPVSAPKDWTVFRLNDQHTYLRISNGDDVEVGDLICFGISHPCTTFDRWRLTHLVDDNWTSIGVMPTFF